MHPRNKLYHRNHSALKDFGLGRITSHKLFTAVQLNDTLVCQLPYNAQIMALHGVKAKRKPI